MRSHRACRLALAAILALAAGLRLWQLDQNGYGRQYYAAGVRSMLAGWHAFFFNSFDPAGFVSLDKPPVALWLQVASAGVLGFGPIAVLLPQVIEGVVAVALIHRLVARRFGAPAGLAAALFLAVTPIAVAVDRSNNTESCLIMVLLLAAWAALRAAETGGLVPWLLSMALVGVGFNVKMAAALAVVPAFAVAWCCADTPLSLRRRVAHLALGAIVLTLVSLSWVVAFDLTPPSQRPYAGSTRHNSMLELALLHNGVDRFVRKARASAPVDGSDVSPAIDATAPATALWDRTPVGPLRLATPHLAAQMAWWLPLAVAGAWLGGRPWRGLRRLSPPQTDIVVWVGWAAAYGAAFSFAGGVFHTYYVAVLGPPLAALAGIGSAALWARARDAASPSAIAFGLAATAAWQAYIAWGNASLDGSAWATEPIVASIAAMAVLAAAAFFLPRGSAGAAAAWRTGAFASVLAMPLAWACSTVLVRPNVATPAADIAAYTRSDAPAAAPARPRARRLFAYLHAQRGPERFLLAVPNATQAAPMIVRTGEPVMAMGGYLGRDPIVTPADLERMAAHGELRFVLLGGPALVPADSPREQALAEWVRTHGMRVDPSAWREPPADDAKAATTTRGPVRFGAPAELYDLRPATLPERG